MRRAPLRVTERDDAAPRCVGFAIVVLLHVAALAALLRIEVVRSAVVQTAPVFVSLIPREQPRIESVLPPVLPKAAPRREPPRLISTDVRSAVPATELVAPAPIESVAAEPQVVAVLPPPVPSAPLVPKLISNVEYVRAPQVEYPAISRRLREQGRVVLRVLIGRSGRAEQVEVQTSSGSERLDKAAAKAAREALYRPYSENGEAISVWALVPTLFELS